jgi:hypothetical protein
MSMQKAAKRVKWLMKFISDITETGHVAIICASFSAAAAAAIQHHL